MTAPQTVDTVVVGAGHAGLAVSRLLTAAGREHVVLDRGRVGERWRSARWDSLHLLTPSWLTRLPLWRTPDDPESFMSARRFVRRLEEYAASFAAPVVSGVRVLRLAAGPNETYDLSTDHGIWRARSVVLATGPHGVPLVPAPVQATDVAVVTSDRYRNPTRLRPGGVLVVGASSSGVQIADELVRSGRDVVLAVGRHTRVPRRYRGMDIFWWLTATGRLARTIDEVPDPEAARRETSMQLVGRAVGDHAGNDVDLAALQDRGVRLAGRLTGLEGQVARFGENLSGDTADADRRLGDLLASFDRYADSSGLGREVLPPVRPRAVNVPAAPARLDLHAERIRTVVLAAGFRPDHHWVDLPIVDPDGTVRQTCGVTDAPGVYVVGQRFQHRRDSGFIDGARHDARAVVRHLTGGAVPPRGALRGTLTGEEPT
ncbi:MAG: NAD(P)/FAD-dependent oxidoreductase [Nocardioides sp.]